jgi:predicted small secreted protein
MPKFLIAALATLLTGCSEPQFYGAGQAWQKTECQKLQDAAERSRCMASTNTSYEDYRRERDAARAKP